MGYAEFQRLFGSGREALKAGFSIIVCSDFEFDLAQAHESVTHQDIDFGVVDGLMRGVFDREIDGARSGVGADVWDVIGREGEGAGCEQERDEEQFVLHLRFASTDWAMRIVARMGGKGG